MNPKTLTFLLVGVGGQGTILAADLLAFVAMESGLDVKVSEIHGMAQRGGSVVTVVRIGEAVHSMVCDKGDADFIIAFEMTEALRAVPYLASDGRMLVSDEVIRPMAALSGAPMPTESLDALRSSSATVVPAQTLARSIGNPKTVNVVLLGALSNLLPYSQETWLSVIGAHVPPATIEANEAAFLAGRQFMKEQP